MIGVLAALILVALVALMLAQVIADEYGVRLVTVPRLVLVHFLARRHTHREVIVVDGVPVTIERTGVVDVPLPGYDLIHGPHDNW